MQSVIELENVGCTYKGGVEALRGVSLQVMPGEVFAFLGPNGAGKTTTINILMGFQFPSAGSIRVLGRAPGSMEANRRTGFLPENFALHPFLTPESLLHFHARLAKLPHDKAATDIPRLLAQVKLLEAADRKVGKLSRGMAQRLGLAQALLGDPDLLILDEPTSGLDPLGHRDVRELILDLKGRGKTVFLSSHVLSEVEQVCDRIAVIDRGELKQAGTVSELLDRRARVLFAVDCVPQETEAALASFDATVERDGAHVQVTVPAEHKHAVAVTLWAAGCDVIAMNPARSTLEEFFVQTVGQA